MHRVGAFHSGKRLHVTRPSRRPAELCAYRSARGIRDALTPHAYGRRHGSSQQATAAGESQAAGRARPAARVADVGGRRPIRKPRYDGRRSTTDPRGAVGRRRSAPPCWFRIVARHRAGPCRRSGSRRRGGVSVGVAHRGGLAARVAAERTRATRPPNRSSKSAGSSRLSSPSTTTAATRRRCTRTGRTRLRRIGRRDQPRGGLAAHSGRKRGSLPQPAAADHQIARATCRPGHRCRRSCRRPAPTRRRGIAATTLRQTTRCSPKSVPCSPRPSRRPSRPRPRRSPRRHRS